LAVWLLGFHGDIVHLSMVAESPARITRVVLKNYKSIVHCDVELKPLTILVGPNGSGKSNFVDALSFVKQALVLGLDQAVRNRGNALRILSEGRPAGASSFSIDLGFRLSDGSEGRFAFEIKVAPDAEFRVVSEVLERGGLDEPIGRQLYRIGPDGASMWASNQVAGTYPVSAGDRLYLVAYSGMPEARPVYDLLTSMVFYSPEPSLMRAIRPRETERRLRSDGANVASILRRVVKADDPELLERITAYLARILPVLRAVRAEDLAGYDLLMLRQSIPNTAGWWDAQPDQISDGTLRALGVLVALFQGRLGGKSETSLVGIEEPEAGIHPAAARILLGAMQDASYTTQVLATTHSADMLTMGDVDLDSLLVVAAENGVTQIGPLDEVSRSAVRDRLYTVGELIQMDYIRPKAQVNGSSDDATTPAPPVRQT
jgi:predicted ATPase